MTETRTRRRDLAILCGVVVLLMSAVSLANLSVPVLADSTMRATSAELTWFVDAYVIAFACLLLPSEMIGERFGEGRVLVAGLALFAVASVVALCAPGMPLLIASRAVAGIGAGIALPQTLSILLKRGGGMRQATIVAAWTASTSLAGIVGNGLGGPLVAASGWRSAFAVTAPLAAVAAVLVVLTVGVRARPDRRAPLDLAGTGLFVLAAVGTLVSVIEAPALLRTAPALLAVPVAIAVASSIGFVRVQRRRSHPLLHLEVFRDPTVRAASLGITATFAGLFTLFSLHAHIVQTVRGLSAGISGLSLVPISVAMFIVTYATVPLVRRWGLGVIAAAGLLTSSIGYLGVIAWGADGSFLLYESALVVVGVGGGLCSSPLSTRLTTSYGRFGGRAGAGINSTLRELASATGVGVAGVALTLALSTTASATDATAVAAASVGAFWFVIAVLLVSLLAMTLDARLVPQWRARVGGTDET
ncbi:MFS transporter [Microbacterium oryzae]|uniref:MFS transporter n=1 Tax=Microbacterium oryzae TaxID=743009 RepID=UPI0025B17C3E|nr:MFS transporter [Microbacterium oryzae]MDN3310327.1 MFS transporter [Microbacterium oryzae]